MVARVEAALGPVDLLRNNAGRFGPIGPVAATDPDEWWQALEVNLRGPLYCARAVPPRMLSRGHGRIVNVSSGAGFAAVPMLSAYAVSKAGLYRFSENLAAETRGHGVMVSAVNPGLMRTAMSESALACGEPSIERWFKDAFANRRMSPRNRRPPSDAGFTWGEGQPDRDHRPRTAPAPRARAGSRASSWASADRWSTCEAET
jgi:NAD(P)-dependent dehydrogenase (short-subunit alcohol dehydrogenase family)